MEKITLTLQEIYALESEVNGVVSADGKVVSQGLLRQKLGMVPKYWLTLLSKKLQTEKQIIDDLRDELIKKHGEPDAEGVVRIPMFLENSEEETKTKLINPKFLAFKKELEQDLLTQEKDIEFVRLPLSSFQHVETEEVYEVFQKLVNPEN